MMVMTLLIMLLLLVLMTGTEPAWIDVVTDMMMSQLSQDQSLVRVIVNLAFTQLIPHYTECSLQLITDVRVFN